MAFAEQGVAMLSSVLNSQRAIQVNIAIMRAFVRLRYILATHADLDEFNRRHRMARLARSFGACRQMMSLQELRKQRAEG